MTLEEAVKILEYYNKWRQGYITPMPNPIEITQAIKIILKHLKQ